MDESNRPMPIKFGLEIGHTPAAGGASHADTHLTEYDFNQTLARAVARKVAGPVDVFSRDWDDPKGSGLPEKINRRDYDAVIAFHCNAFKGVADGCETLYWPTSEGGQFLAETLVQAFEWALENGSRGATPRDYNSENTRGAHLLGETEPVYVLAEPFFIDDDSDLRGAQARLPELVEAYAEAVRSYREHFG